MKPTLLILNGSSQADCQPVRIFESDRTDSAMPAAAPFGIRLHDLTAEELEAHITDCGRLMQAAYDRYEAHGCLGDRGEAQRWLTLQAEAIAARRLETVTRMESERGLRG